MSAHAAIASAADIQVGRLPIGRMVIVAIAYLAIAIVRATYPLISPLNGVWAGEVTPLDRAVDLLWAMLWLAVLLLSMARQPGGRLWKLIFLVMVSQYVGALQWVPNSVVWSLARVVGIVWVPVWVQLVVTYPTGHFRDRFDRVVVGLAYALAAAFALQELLLVGDSWRLLCNPDCVRNAFVVWPNRELYEVTDSVIVVGFFLVLRPLVIVASGGTGEPPRAPLAGRCCHWSSARRRCRSSGWSSSWATGWALAPLSPSSRVHPAGRSVSSSRSSSPQACCSGWSKPGGAAVGSRTSSSSSAGGPGRRPAGRAR